MPDVFSMSIPHLREWSRRQGVDHRQQNEPVEAINRMMTGIGPPRQVESPSFVSERSVVLVKEPDLDSDTSLEIRIVAYADRPPVVGRYRFVEPAFVAYPELGMDMDDFVGLAWLATEEVPQRPGEEPPLKDPDLSAAICKANLRHGVWHVRPPIYPDRFVVAQRYIDDDPDGDGRLIVIQEVVPTLNADGEWTGTLLVTGESVEMNVWPTMKAANFAPFLWVPEELNNETVILPLTFWHGTWWLKQRPEFGVSLRRGPLAIVDCQPTEATP